MKKYEKNRKTKATKQNFQQLHHFLKTFPNANHAMQYNFFWHFFIFFLRFFLDEKVYHMGKTQHMKVPRRFVKMELRKKRLISEDMAFYQHSVWHKNSISDVVHQSFGELLDPLSNKVGHSN